MPDEGDYQHSDPLTVRGHQAMARMSRPGWPERMRLLADHWKQWSTCVRRKVGAVIYDPDSMFILAVGYNDTPRGELNCGDGGCKACTEGSSSLRLDCQCVHAEMNALMSAARHGMRLEGAKIVTDGSYEGGSYGICDSCKKHLRQAGVTWE